jgi:RNA polymerase sigma-70 factor (ECF subfamily)
MTSTVRFEAHRGRLLGLAYRMLGSRADAEDMVQDAWLKWTRADRTEIENDEAFLTTIVTRLCLDRLKLERIRRQSYIGPWLPEPIVDADALSPQTASEIADDLSYALLLALERLSPLERAAFLLHDVFDKPFAELAATLERSEGAVRQLAARARKSVREARPTRPPAPGKHEELLAAFMTALSDGDADRLKAVLREDAVYISDGGGRTPAATKPLKGADRIVRLLIGARHRYARRAESTSAVPKMINGSAGFVLYGDGILQGMLTIEVDGERIAAVYLVSNPAKLLALTH